MGRKSVTPYKRKGTQYYSAIIPVIDQEGRKRSLGTGDLDTAKAMGTFLETLRSRRDELPLQMMSDGKLKVGAAHRAWCENKWDSFVASLRTGSGNPDIEPLVAEWEETMKGSSKPGPKTARRYVAQVRLLIPAKNPEKMGPKGKKSNRKRKTSKKKTNENTTFLLSNLTSATISAFLAKLGIRRTGRYRAAISKFCKFLIERGIMTSTNPARDVSSSSEGDPRCRYLDAAQVTAVLDALEEPFRTMHATMDATGMEISAILAMRREHIDFGKDQSDKKRRGWDEIDAHGTKTKNRRRRVRILTVRARKLLAAHCEGMPRGALVFPGVTSNQSLDALHAACDKVGIADYHQHDWRHTFSVRELRRGQKPAVVARHLGHANTIMVLKNYGNFAPDATDYIPDPTK